MATDQPGLELGLCETCDGTGKVRGIYDDGKPVACPDCKGTGQAS